MALAESVAKRAKALEDIVARMPLSGLDKENVVLEIRPKAAGKNG